MKKAKITIKNYRCFDDSNPARIEIDNGIISFIGPNNSGKSSLLKMFREFRNIWQELSTPFGINNFVVAKQKSLNIEYVNDQLEIFSDTNNRPISIEFEIEAETADCLTEQPPRLFPNKLKISADRNQPSYWKIELFSESRGVLTPELNRMQISNEIIQVVFGDIWNHVFTEHLSRHFASLHKSLYIGPFRNAINVGATNYYDTRVQI